MRPIHLSLGSPRPRDETVYQYTLMLLFLQESNERRHGHRDGDKFDRLNICLQAYEAALWRGSQRHPFIRV